MANEIYHRSNWGNAVNDIAWGNVYEKFDATNEMFVRSDNYENSNETDKLMAAINPKPSILLTPTAYDNGSLHSVKPVQTLGSELVTNGDFAIDSNWVKGTGWTISGGTANFNGGNNQSLSQDGIVAINKKYKLTYTISNYVQGGINWRFGTSSNLTPIRSANGTYVEYITSTGSDFRGISSGASEFSIDNVSVKEATDADFDFTRSTTATRENSSGNIESVAANLPRIDYLGGTGHILLEPQSTNTATYSNDFTQGYLFNSSGNPSTSNAVLTSQQETAPDGTNNGWLLKDNNNGSTGATGLQYFSTRVNSDDFNTISLFVKKALSNDFVILENSGYDTDGTGRSYFNISNGSLASISPNHTAKIEDYGDGWYRCSITFQTTTDIQGAIYVRLASSNGVVNITRDGTNGVYIFGIQCEADASQNFSTSYIPTSGSPVTRSKDEANNSGSSDLINSTEGVLYAEIAALSEGQSVTTLTISDGSLSNRVLIALTTGELKGQFVSSANNINKTTSGVTIEEFNKIACSYTSTTFKVFVNGTQLGTTSTSLTAVTGLNELAFDRGDGGLDFVGKVKCVSVFKEALTDEELTALTT